ncbi:glycosyltransferase [Paucibacter sp. R3-3]|uniref:Glycosyltransferase n=1 Tax=Roseateles agri TaxID=3098619 RepID=A0ABU5DAZ1_9BURK|nr:glycosyltransferase [Paucibacter sp. R3-3]MDY0743432.1 glycosyltransferase [Paucibacter sp. R3-3]
MTTKPTVALVYFNAGGGHRAAAQALQALIAQQQRGWEVQLVNLFEVLDPKRRFKQLTGAAPEDFYNKRLARGWTLGMAQELKMLQRAIRFFHESIVEILQQHWLATEPDLVVSLVPNFNRALCASVHASLPGVPFATVLTDMADLPPRFWIERGQRQHIVCGTPRALAQARAAGHPDERLSLVSGMVLRPSFYDPRLADPADLVKARRALGLDPARPTGIVMFGGQGSMQMLKIAKALKGEQLILMCGHNAKLARQLQAQGSDAPHAIVGFTAQVAEHLQMADYFIGKPGPGCLSEALHLGLPVITTGGRGTMPQERYNAQWVREMGVGLVLDTMRGIGGATAEMLARLPAFQARVRELDNRAVFEVVDIFDALMKRAAGLDLPLPQFTSDSSASRAVETTGAGLGNSA